MTDCISLIRVLRAHTYRGVVGEGREEKGRGGEGTSCKGRRREGRREEDGGDGRGKEGGEGRFI